MEEKKTIIKKKNITSEKDFIKYLEDPQPFNRIVECELKFINYQFTKKIDLEGFIFKKTVNFNKSLFQEEVNFSKCKFEGEVIFGGLSEHSIEHNVKNTVFGKLADFTNAHFTQKDLI